MKKNNDRILSIVVFLTAIIISFAIFRIETGVWSKRDKDEKVIKRLSARNAELEHIILEQKTAWNEFMDKLIYDNAILSKSNAVYKAKIAELEKKNTTKTSENSD